MASFKDMQADHSLVAFPFQISYNLDNKPYVELADVVADALDVDPLNHWSDMSDWYCVSRLLSDFNFDKQTCQNIFEWYWD